MHGRSVVAPGDPRVKYLVALVAGKDLVLLLGEQFLAIHVVHLHVEGPTLAHKHALAALVWTNVVVPPHPVLLFNEGARVDARRKV